MFELHFQHYQSKSDCEDCDLVTTLLDVMLDIIFLNDRNQIFQIRDIFCDVENPKV